MGVAEGVGAPGEGCVIGCIEDFLRRAISREEGVNLFHGDAGVLSDGNEMFAGVFDAEFGSLCGTDKMPDGVFYILGIYGLVEFELFFAFGEAAGVVERDTALPVMWFSLGKNGEEGIKVVE